MSSIKNDVKEVIYVVFTIILILIVVTTLFFGCSGDLTPIKSALSLMGNYVGGIATLTAAYIASMLFYDWRAEHNNKILATEAKEAFHLFHNQRNYIHRLSYQCKNIIDGSDQKKYSWTSIMEDYNNNFLTLFSSDKDKMSAFCFLSTGQLIYDLTMDYHNEIESLTKYLMNMHSQPHSGYIFLNPILAANLLEKVKIVDTANKNVLNTLKNSYIFIKE